MAGCTASSDTALPPTDQLFGPTAAAVSPDDSVLFVASANSELRYNSGTVAVFDLTRIDNTIAGWTGSQETPTNCSRDADHRETLVCDEADFMVPDAMIRTGNFVTAIGVQDRTGGRARLIIPTRGDPSVEWADWDGAQLSCSSEGAFGLCDDAHRLTYIHDDSALGSLPDEPFDVFVDSAHDFALVTHLSNGAVTLIDSPRDGNATIADVTSGYFATNASGYVGASGVSGRIDPSGGDIVYVGSPYENRIQTFTVGRPVNNAPAYLVPGEWFFLDVGTASGQSSSDTRALEFAGSGERLYLMNRNPPTVQSFDTSYDETGAPRNELRAAVDICRQGERIAVADGGDGDRVYVTCFEDGQVYVIDPRGDSNTPDVISTGRGPYGITSARTRNRIYVTNFLEDTVSVIDTSLASPTRDRVVLKLGVPKAP